MSVFEKILSVLNFFHVYQPGNLERYGHGISVINQRVLSRFLDDYYAQFDSRVQTQQVDHRTAQVNQARAFDDLSLAGSNQQGMYEQQEVVRPRQDPMVDRQQPRQQFVLSDTARSDAGEGEYVQHIALPKQSPGSNAYMYSSVSAASIYPEENEVAPNLTPPQKKSGEVYGYKSADIPSHYSSSGYSAPAASPTFAQTLTSGLTKLTSGLTSGLNAPSSSYGAPSSGYGTSGYETPSVADETRVYSSATSGYSAGGLSSAGDPLSRFFGVTGTTSQDIHVRSKKEI